MTPVTVKFEPYSEEDDNIEDHLQSIDLLLT